ncbi:unnamed protein product [Phytomonas sp. EM1]|nr:unnamed protein product [Phytomonas sp. EM1]|eukprot:CCW63813.1 unnamed protein product [Phytomonas sp. isolate EM1]
MREAIISTSNTFNRGDSFGPTTNGSQPPSLSEVALHVRRLQAVLLNTAADDSATVPKGGAMKPSYLGGVVIKPTELDRVTALCDLLSDIYAWAVEEGSSFVMEPSILAQEGVPEVVCACLLCQRPRVITAALRVARHLLRHPASFAELHRVVADYYTSQKEEVFEGGCSHLSPSLTMVRFLDMLLRNFSNSADLVAATVEVAAELSTATGPIPYTADDFVGTDFVSNVLSGCQRHGEDPLVATPAVVFFAALVQLPREPPAETPVAVLVTHLGSVLGVMVRAIRKHAGNASIRKAILKFFAICAQYDQNRERLLQVGAYAVAIATLTGKAGEHSDLEILEPAVECVSYCIPLLDSFQCRSLLLGIRGLLMHRGEIAVMRLTLALLYGFLLTLPPSVPQGRHSLYAQPETLEPEGSKSNLDELGARGKCTRVEPSDLLDHLPLHQDTRRFIHRLCIPQLTMHVMDYYRNELRILMLIDNDNANNGEDEEDDMTEDVEQVFSLAERCVAAMSP